MARFLIVVLLVACATAAHTFAPVLSYAEGQTTAEERAGAQFNLAVMYSTGIGVAADIVQAYARADRAASGGEPNAGRLRDSLKQKMTAEQIADAAPGARADESSTRLTKQHAVTQSDRAAAVKSAQSKR